jgi:hypothetical protein
VPRRAARVALLAVAAALALTACPATRRGAPPERYLPARTGAVLLLPEVERAAKDLVALLDALSGFPGVGDAAALRGAVSGQLGLDPLDAGALERAGFDPRGGAALAVLEPPDGVVPSAGAPPPVLLVLPVGRASEVEGLLARLARDRLGARTRASAQRGPIRVVTFRREATDDAPQLSYALLERYALVSAGPSGPEQVGRAASLAADASLAAAPAFASARRALGEGAALIAYLPPRSSLTPAGSPLRDGAAFSLAASEVLLRLRAAVVLGDRAATFAKLAGDGAAGRLAARLAPDALLVARYDGDLAALGDRLLPLVPSRERDALAARGLDLARDVFGVLLPGGALSLSLSPGFSLPALTWPVLTLDPPRVLELEVLAPVKEGAARAVERWARYADPDRPPATGPDGVTRVPTPSGEIAWKLADGRLALAGGRPGRLTALLARAAGQGRGWEPPVPEARGALQGGLGGAVLDVPRLTSALRALPPASFGSGPDGFVVRSMVDRLLEPASRLAALSLRAELAGDALVFTLEVHRRAPGSAP